MFIKLSLLGVFMRVMKLVGILILIVGVVLGIVMPVMSVFSGGSVWIDWAVSVILIILGIYVIKRNSGVV
jgi:uncharacterized membrane protein YesL